MKAGRQLLVVTGILLFAAIVKADEAGTMAVTTIALPADIKALTTVRCQPCHFELKVKPALILNTGKWFRLAGENFEVERRVFLEHPPNSMPMGAMLDEKERTLLRNWFQKLHNELK